MTELEIKEEYDRDPLLGTITSLFYIYVHIRLYVCIYVRTYENKNMGAYM
jgi:hypothetical protein